MLLVEPEYERVVRIEANKNTGGVNIYEIGLDGSQKWRLGHIQTDELERRVEEGRYVS